MPFVLQQPEEQTDNWDDDFEEGISFSKLQGKEIQFTLYLDRIFNIFSCLALEKTSADDEKLEDDHNAQTIRPSRSPAGLGKTVPLPLAKPPSPGLPPVVEDYSDLGFDEDDDRLQEKMSEFKVIPLWVYFPKAPHPCLYR